MGIVNIGFGNIGSCVNMLDTIDKCEPVIVSNFKDLELTDLLILPGVGSFDTGMKLLKKNDLCNALIDYSNNKSLLGICLGMQLICEGSEEGSEKGLGLISGYFEKFPNKDSSSSPLNVPCMGWNFVEYESLKGYDPKSYSVNQLTRYYFVHSYYFSGPKENVCGWSTYGLKYGSVINSNTNSKLIGVQFHPEKSHDYGRVFLSNWINNNS